MCRCWSHACQKGEPKTWVKTYELTLYDFQSKPNQNMLNEDILIHTINNLATDPLTISWFRHVQTSSVTCSLVFWDSLNGKIATNGGFLSAPGSGNKGSKGGKGPGTAEGAGREMGKEWSWSGRIPRLCRWALNIFELSIFSGIICPLYDRPIWIFHDCAFYCQFGLAGLVLTWVIA